MPTRNIKTYSKKGKINKVTNNFKFGSLLNFDQNTIKKNVHKTKVYNTRSKNDFDVSLESNSSVYVTNLTSDESIRATWAETTFDKLKRNSCGKITNQCKKVNKKLTKQKKTENKVCELSAANSTGNTIEGEGIGDHQLIIEKKKDHSPVNSLHLELTQCATRPEFAWNLSKSQSFQINDNPTKDKENSKNIFSSTLIEKQYSHANISHCFKNISTVASTPFKKSNNNLTSLFCVSPIPTTSNSVFENSPKKIPSILEEQSLDNDIDLSVKKSNQDFSSDLFSTQRSYPSDKEISDNEINKNSSFQYKRLREKNNNSTCCTALEEDTVSPKIVKKKEKSPPCYRSSIEFIKSINLDADSLKSSKCITSLHENSKINVMQDKNLNPITVDNRTIPIVLVEKLSDYEIMKYSKNVTLNTSISKQNSLKKKSKPIILSKVIEKHKTCSKGKLNVSTSKKIRDTRVPALMSTPKNTSNHLNYNKNTNGIINNQVLTLSLTPINITKYLNHNENASFVSHNTSIRENSTIGSTDFISSNSSLSVNTKEFNDFDHGSMYIHNENDAQKNVITLSHDSEILNDTCALYLNDSHNSRDNSSQFELSLNESIIMIDKNSKLMNQSVINISDDEESVNYEIKSTKRISKSVINILSENIVNKKKLPLTNVVNSSLSTEEHDSFLEYNETRSETPADSINNKSAVNVNVHESQNDQEHILSSININEPVTNISPFNSLQMDNSLTCEEQNFTFKSLQSKSEKINESKQIINTSTDDKVIQSNNKNISEQIVSKINHKLNDSQLSSDCLQIKNSIILKPGKKWRRSLAILRSPKLKEQNRKGKKWLENIIEIMKMQPEYSKQTLSLETLPQNINEKNMRRHSEFPYSRLSKRFSVRIVQEEKYSEEDNLKLSDLKSYATSINDIADKGNTDISKGYESKANHCGTQFHDLYDITNSLNELRLSSSSLPSQKEDREFVSARKIVLQRCNQDEPLSFENIYSDSVLKKCHKIGEGVYGEVYLLKEPNGTATVLKVIPIEGDITVNGESQKKFNEVLSEIIISQELSALRQGFYNKTSCFVEVKRIKCVQGCYPNRLTELWELYDEDRGSENDHPSIFPDDQLYIVFELAHGGQDLEGFKFLNAEQSYSVFLQAVFALAVAESELNFEHRDLHWGNLLVSYTTEREIIFNIKGEEFRVRSNGVKAVIIDFTLSRCTFDGCCIYNDLSEDQDLFTSDGDYQFEVYRLMQKKNGNEWGHFEPYTNILWLRYIILKMIDGARYTREVSKKHKSHIVMMQSIEPSILTFANAELLAKSGILKQL